MSYFEDTEGKDLGLNYQMPDKCKECKNYMKKSWKEDVCKKCKELIDTE